MSEKRKPCPTCHGKKVIAGSCQCSSEWRGSMDGDQWQECQCTPELECPTCRGSGYE